MTTKVLLSSEIDDEITPSNTVRKVEKEVDNGRMILTKNELVEKIETRKGRRLHQRIITLSPSFQDKNNHFYKEKRSIQLLFLHGLCANSAQFDSLIESIGEKILQQKDAENLLGIECTLFDALGLGKSIHNPLDWKAYSDKESAKDVKFMFQSMTQSNRPCFIISHSYGVSQALKLICDLSSSKNKSLTNLYGIICIGGMLLDGPNSLAQNGGSPMFKLPTFALKMLQPELIAKFIQCAYHPSSASALKDKSWENCSNDDMNIIKAYHRQTNWATVYDAAMVMVKSLVIHGEEDLLIPLMNGKHLADSLMGSSFHVIPETRHQVFEEKPDIVAGKLINFINNSLQNELIP